MASILITYLTAVSVARFHTSPHQVNHRLDQKNRPLDPLNPKKTRGSVESTPTHHIIDPGVDEYCCNWVGYFGFWAWISLLAIDTVFFGEINPNLDKFRISLI